MEILLIVNCFIWINNNPCLAVLTDYVGAPWVPTLTCNSDGCYWSTALGWVSIISFFSDDRFCLQNTNDMMLLDRCVGQISRNVKIRCGGESLVLLLVRWTGPRWLMILMPIVLWIELNTFRILRFVYCGKCITCIVVLQGAGDVSQT